MDLDEIEVTVVGKLGQSMNTPMNPLLEWLRAQVADYDKPLSYIFWPDPAAPLLPFGSHALYGEGHDRDFMIDRERIPEDLKHLIPAPTVDPAYTEPFSRFNDEERGFDFLICEKRRVTEFRFAMDALNFMRNDRPDEFYALQTNKPMRVAVFRMACRCSPGSELFADPNLNPDIDRLPDSDL